MPDRSTFVRTASLALLISWDLASCHNGGRDASILPVDPSIVALRITRGTATDYLLRWDLPSGEINPAGFRVVVLPEPYVGGPLERFVVAEVSGSVRRAPVDLRSDTGVYYLAVQPVRDADEPTQISRILAVDTADRLAFQTADVDKAEIWFADPDLDGGAGTTRMVAPGRIVGWTPGSSKLAVRTSDAETALLAADVPDLFTYATDPVTLPDTPVEGLEIGSNGLAGYRAERDAVAGFFVRVLGFEFPVHEPGRAVADFLWSPSGDAVVFLQQAAQSSGYEAVMADTQRLSRTRLHRLLFADESVRNLRWSPSGRFVALSISRLAAPESGGLYVHDLQHRTTYYVSPLHGDIIEWGPRVSPPSAVDDGETETLAFTTRNNGAPQQTTNQFIGMLTWPLDPTRSLAAQTTYPLEVVQRVDQLVWTSDGANLMFIHTADGQRHLARYRLGGVVGEVALGAAGSPVELLASVDGRVACVVDRLGSQDLLMWIDGVIAPWFSAPKIHRVAWSPYGGRLAVLAGDAQARLYRVDAAGATDVSVGIGPFRQVVGFRWSDRAAQPRNRVTLQMGVEDGPVGQGNALGR